MAIAEWRGWRILPSGIAGISNWQRPDGTTVIAPNGFSVGPPLYTDDLNAMHEVKQELRSQTGHLSVHNLYRNFLIILMGDMNPGKKLWENGSFLGTWTDAIQVAEATAMQEAVAFTKAIGKWKE